MAVGTFGSDGSESHRAHPAVFTSVVGRHSRHGEFHRHLKVPAEVSHIAHHFQPEPPREAHRTYHSLRQSRRRVPAPPPPPPLIQSTAGLEEVHQAIHKAAAFNHVDVNLAGAIAQLESLSTKDKQNAVLGSSTGLFQMQLKTSLDVMTRYSDELVAGLNATPDKDGKYKDIIADLQAHRMPSLGRPNEANAHYNAVILDPYFNALLGTNLIKLNASGYHMRVDNTSHLTDIYSMHLTGRLIRPGAETLVDAGILQDHIDKNHWALGADLNNTNPTTAEAYASLDRKIHKYLNDFMSKDIEFGLQAKPQPLHVGHRARGHIQLRGHHGPVSPHA